jgi:hypothetical protein
MTTNTVSSDTGEKSSAFWLIIVGIIVSVLIAAVAFSVLFPDARSFDDDPTPHDHLFQLALAVHAYAEVRDLQLPPAVVTDKTGRPLYSWRVLLLPFLHEESLFNQFHLDEPWDSEHNKTLIEKMPAVYRSPYERGSGRPGFTFYQVFVGPGTAFERPG